jgi:M6 family metalloprotease-like protein
MQKLIILLVSGVLLVGCSETPPPEGTSPTSPNLTFELSSLREDPELCKIQEDSRMRKPGDPITDFGSEKEIQGRYSGNATAFPFSPTVLPVTGELNVAMVLVDWADFVGTDDDYEFYELNAQLLSDFYWMASEGKLKVNVEISETWFRIPGSYTNFAMTVEEEGQSYDQRPKKQVLYDAVVAASDADTDYSDIQVVIPAWPRGKTISEQGPHEFNFNWNAVMNTDEKEIYDIAGAGNWFLNHTEFSKGPWIYYAHEMGHMLGIPHQANEEQEFKDGTYERDESWWASNPINGFDIMGNQDGAIKTLSAWLRWLPGWLDDDQVTCIAEDSIVDEYFALNPINELNGENEALIIKLSETMVLVVESRRWDERFDRPIIHSRDGLVVYTVDATKASAQGSQTILSPRDITSWVEVGHWRHSEELDGNFCQGDAVDVSNIRIENVSSREGVDFVRVTKTESYVDPSPPLAGSRIGSVNEINNDCVRGPGADFQYQESLGLFD